MDLATPLLLSLLLWPAAVAAAPVGDRVIEIRSYNLKPGTRDRFHDLFVTRALPLLELWKVDVVAFGPSLHDRDSYYLMRSFSSVEERERSEDAFYASEQWRGGPREAILACIESYATVVVRVDETTLRGLRKEEKGMGTGTASADLATLIDLNRAYLRAVQTSDVRWFEEILAPDFLCTSSDGSLLDRQAFLEHTARPATISGLEGHDVDVRIMGDFAIIHARTTFAGPDGRLKSSRYTDVWARREGRWLAVAAQVTRY
jgi:ketosteroid isomerase-like protein